MADEEALAAWMAERGASPAPDEVLRGFADYLASHINVSFVTPSVSCRSMVSTASASGQPSNSHVETVRLGGSPSR